MLTLHDSFVAAKVAALDPRSWAMLVATIMFNSILKSIWFTPKQSAWQCKLGTNQIVSKKNSNIDKVDGT